METEAASLGALLELLHDPTTGPSYSHGKYSVEHLRQAVVTLRYSPQAEESDEGSMVDVELLDELITCLSKRNLMLQLQMSDGVTAQELSRLLGRSTAKYVNVLRPLKDKVIEAAAQSRVATDLKQADELYANERLRSFFAFLDESNRGFTSSGKLERMLHQCERKGGDVAEVIAALCCHQKATDRMISCSGGGATEFVMTFDDFEEVMTAGFPGPAETRHRVHEIEAKTNSNFPHHSAWMIQGKQAGKAAALLDEGSDYVTAAAVISVAQNANLNDMAVEASLVHAGDDHDGGEEEDIDDDNDDGEFSFGNSFGKNRTASETIDGALAALQQGITHASINEP